MRKKLALCIPTYNRPECIRELLLELAPLTDSCFSIHIFDSSEDEKTGEVAAAWSGRQVFYEYLKLPT